MVEWGSAVEPRRWGVYRVISKPGDVVVTIETRTKLNADSLSLRMDPDRYKDAASEVRSSLVTRLGSLPVRLAVVVCGGGYDWANQNTNSPPKKKKSAKTAAATTKKDSPTKSKKKTASKERSAGRPLLR